MVCEKIRCWHLASADDEINSARGCGSPMSTGHTPRFHRNQSATDPSGKPEGEKHRGGRQGDSTQNLLFYVPYESWKIKSFLLLPPI